MKKIIYSALFLLSLCACFNSCKNDEEGSEVMSQTPAQDVAATYNGAWTTTIKWATDDPKARTNSKVLFDGTVNGQVVIQATSAYSANMTTTGGVVIGVDTLGLPTQYEILVPGAGTNLQSAVNVSEQAGAIYNLSMLRGNSDSSLGMLTTSGIQAQILNGTLVVAFNQQTTKKGAATKKDVTNAAYGLCEVYDKGTQQYKPTSLTRCVVIIPSEVTSYTYSFTGNK